jgi:hypothetical protein
MSTDAFRGVARKVLGSSAPIPKSESYRRHCRRVGEIAWHTAIIIVRRRAILPTRLRGADAWAKLRNFSQSLSLCQAIVPTLPIGFVESMH